ncbi:hypothetical protein B0T11DRAFT_281799 [Plectosphaerella cucumerina]|uniref:Uncharacterized protein n=1 Tax=Plectosphaerella cucumerina TaxID=40658 RepID=A0A8K0TGF6_9PEZI|nr:hypothetical protein B0T11DRAFT_281799 [Plectosphaerella cucumerina]
MDAVESHDGSHGVADKTRTKSSMSPQNGTHRRTGSGGLLSKFPFMRSAPTDVRQIPDAKEGGSAQRSSTSPASAMQFATLQQKTRRRRGSLRKVALLGRGAQRERRDAKQLTIDTAQAAALDANTATTTLVTGPSTTISEGLGISVSNADLTPRPSMDGFASRPRPIDSPSSYASPVGGSVLVDRRASYNSTTDEEDVLQMAGHDNGTTAHSSGSESYFGPRTVVHPPTRGSALQAKSPLSYSGLATTPLPATEADYDYSETEWWGWVILVVTWVVFVVGMGSCLGIWSWAWDVGTTPYAPPELEDDDTLPIVGYYPALMILTCIMAWIWVVVAWVGMKYFRHAKLGGD